MNVERWRQIDDLFQQALEVETQHRFDFVKRASRDDDELHREVLSLLHAGEGNEAFLNSPIHGGVSRLLTNDAGTDVDPSALVGQRVGAYRLESLIAVGGMGAVYRAMRDDDEFHRTVAVKLVRRSVTGSSTGWREDLRRRFQLERQVLANLDHQNIARLLDGGTSSQGQPYFVMEYIDGLPIDVYCVERQISVRERLQLMVQICGAVQHAHQNLIIHRDLKPTNILVTPQGVPKLLDFGLAKLLEPHSVAGRGRTTATGAFMGTFAYAAPEQVSGDSGRQDTRSDVYALGLILYRLLTNEHAYDVDGPVSEVIHRITDVDPVAPSARNRLVSGEMDTIILKAVAKDQNRRYQSAGDLAADIERFLRNEPILARVDSRWYVLRKNARRYRVPLAAIFAILVMLTAFAAYATVQSQRLADRSRQLASSLRISNIERGRLMGLSGNLAMAELSIWPEHQGVQDRLSHWALWELYANQPCTRTIRLEGLNLGAAVQCGDAGTLVVDAIQSDEGVLIVDALTGTVRHRIAPLNRSARVIVGKSTGWIFISDGQRGIVSRHVSSPHEALEVCEYAAAPPLRLAISPDESMIAFVSGSELFVCRATDGRIERVINQSRTHGRLYEFSADNSLIYYVNEDNELQSMRIADGSIETICTGTSRGLTASAVSPDGRYLAVDIDFKRLSIIDLSTKGVVAEIDELGGWLSNLVFDPDKSQSHLLAVGCMDKVLRMIDVPSGRVVMRLTGHSDTAAAAFTLDGNQLITSSPDGRVRFWELKPWLASSNWSEQPATIFNMRLSPDQRMLAACYGAPASFVRLLDPATGSVIAELRGHSESVSSIAFDPLGNYLVSASYDQTLRTWSLHDTNIPSKVIRDQAGIINAVSVSPDGKMIAYASDGPRVVVVNASTGVIDQQHDIRAQRVPSIDWAPQGNHIAVAALSPGRVELIDTEQKTMHSIAEGLETRVVRFSPDGSMLAAGTEDGNVHLWHMEPEGDPQLIHTFVGGQQDIFCLDFIADGTMLAASGRSGEVRLWDTQSGRHLATLGGHADMVFALEFVNNDLLLSAGRDGIISAWNLAYYDRHIAGNADAFSPITIDAER